MPEVSPGLYAQVFKIHTFHTVRSSKGSFMKIREGVDDTILIQIFVLLWYDSIKGELIGLLCTQQQLFGSLLKH